MVANMDKDTVIRDVNQIFGHIPRPKIMLRDPNHCEECMEHEAVMQAVTRESISLTEIGNPGWDPICYISDETFVYFMPAFVRLVLEDDYLFQFFFHLGHTRRLDAFTLDQRRVAAQVISYIGENMTDALTENFLTDDFNRLVDKLADAF
jgi:hypothetical protein